MAEYLIQEESLIEIADALRNEFEGFDGATQMIANHTTLTNITIPDSITTIGALAFAGCTNLTNVIIPDSITTIGIAAFINCSKLTSVTIPDSVTNISGGLIFTNCFSLTDMYLNPAIPPALATTNAISTATTTIHVPIGSGDAYRNATNWSSFADKIVEDIVV